MKRSAIYCFISLWLIVGHSHAMPPGLTTEHLLVTQFNAHHVAYVDPRLGVIDQVKVGQAPYTIALHNNELAYISTANGVAVLDVEKRQRTALIPYRSKINRLSWGEYRQGGMGIDVSPDGKLLAVGVYLGQGNPSQLEIISTLSHQVVAQIAVGERPFQVLFSPDGKQVYSIDHDSYSVTSINISDLSTRTFDTALLGFGSFDKPHYAVLDTQGRLLLPIQGRVLLVLDPTSGEIQSHPMTASTHQHGISIADDGRLFIVGTGPAGSVSGGTKLTIVDQQYKEKHIPLTREHENVLLSSDGRTAYLTGGNSFTGGWDGITIIQLDQAKISTIEVSDQPLGVALWRPSESDK